MSIISGFVIMCSKYTSEMVEQIAYFLRVLYSEINVLIVMWLNVGFS